MIISLLNQKGGVGKSSLARALAVEFARNGWSVHVADLDRAQQTFFSWSQRRAEEGIKPEIETALYADPKAALKASKNSDVLIVDGKAFADTHALAIAQESDLVIVPVGVSLDDLEPSLKLAVELVNKGIKRAESLLLFVESLTRVTRKLVIQDQASKLGGSLSSRGGYHLSLHTHRRWIRDWHSLRHSLKPSIPKQTA